MFLAAGYLLNAGLRSPYKFTRQGYGERTPSALLCMVNAMNKTENTIAIAGQVHLKVDVVLDREDLHGRRRVPLDGAEKPLKIN
jgi:hypothetical protein